MTEYPDQSDLDPVKREALQWVIRLTSGKATAADAAALKRWRAQSPAHEAAFAEARHLRHTLRLAAKELVAEGPAPATIVRFPQKRHSPLGRRAFLGGALAASAAAVGYLAYRPPLGLWPSFAELQADYRTATGEQREVTPAKGVSVAMNTQTSIAVPSSQRIDLITGEAVISAARPAADPITVRAGASRAIASNATFDIRRDGPSGCVTCLAGSVELRQGGQSRNLGANQQVSYVDGRLGEIVSADPSLVTAWRQGLLIFHNERLSDVVAEVNRYRPGRIIITNSALSKRLVNGVFHVDKIDGVINQIRMLGANVTSLPGGVVLLS